MASTPPNNDVVTEILSHLPVKSLLRFRAVSKFWRDVIDSPSFRKSHVQNQTKNNNEDDTVFLQFNFLQNRIWELSIMLLDNGKSPSLKLYNNFPNNQKFSDDYMKPSLDVRLVGPVNGLICINNSLWTAICNPFLGEIKKLPMSPLLLIRASLSNPRRIISRQIGIGFDYVTQDYKVMQLLSFFGHRRVHAEVYSRTTNSWRELGGDGVLDQALYLTEPIKSSCKKGSFAHWQGFRHTREDQVHIILTFDMKNEVFRITTTFSEYDERMWHIGRMEIFAKDDDSFLLFIFPKHDFLGSNVMKIFESRCEDGKNRLSWNYVMSVGPFSGMAMPKTLWGSDRVVLDHFSARKELLFYDYRATKLIGCFVLPPSWRRFQIIEYQGSFISP